MAFTIVNTGGRVIEVNGGTGTIFGKLGTGPGALVQTVAIARIRYVNANPTAGDACILTDFAGNVIFESEAVTTGAEFSDEVELGKVPPFQGLILSTLTGARGNVYIYLR